MRKYIVVAITLFVVFFTTMVFAETPAPFAKAKEYALSGQPNQYGNYIVSMEVREDGEQTTYFFGYLSELKIIGVGIVKGGSACVFQFEEETQTFSIWYNGMMFEGDPEKIKQGAFDIFRKLVGANAI